MNEKIKGIILSKFEEDVKMAEHLFKTLKDDDKSSKLIHKLEKLSPQFIYHVFSDIFSGFGSIEDTIHTLSVLLQGLLDDVQIYAESVILNQKIIDDHPNVKEMRMTKFNTCERGIAVDQDDILHIIKECEIVDIVYRNNAHKMYINGMCNVCDIEEHTSEWVGGIAGFCDESLGMLSDELVNVFNTKGGNMTEPRFNIDREQAHEIDTSNKDDKVDPYNVALNKIALMKWMCEGKSAGYKLDNIALDDLENNMKCKIEEGCDE